MAALVALGVGFAWWHCWHSFGQTIDQFVARDCTEVGTALLKPVENIDLLVVKIGAVNSEKANIGVLQGLGLEGVAAQAAFEELETAVGKSGVKALEDFGKSWQT